MKKIINRDNLPIKVEIIDYAEQHFQIKFPESYLKLLKISNGGTLKRRWLDVQETEGAIKKEEFIYLDRLLGIVPPNSKSSFSETNIFDTHYLKQEWGIQQDKIIFIAGDGHYWIALDYRLSKEPRITYFDTENAAEYVLFNHFDQLLEHLYESMDGNNTEIDLTSFTNENLFEKLHANNFKAIKNGLLIWSHLVFHEDKAEDMYYDRIMEIFKLEGLDFLTDDEQVTLRSSIGFTVCDMLKYEKNIVDKKFLEELLTYLESNGNLGGIQYIVEIGLSTYKKRWGYK